MSGLITKRDIQPIPIDLQDVEVGQWYWVSEKNNPLDRWFGCVVRIGSNFIKLQTPYDQDERIHFKDFHTRCTQEKNPESVIRKEISEYHQVVREKLGEIQKVTARLGVSQQLKIELQAESTKALSVLSGTDNVDSYKKSLIQAKEKELPELFKEVEEANRHLVTWTKAQSLPMKAAAAGMKDCLGLIDDRIFNISLYAGLSEDVVQISDGKPAEMSEKLRILQRMLFMDEEALLDYKRGGMEFKDIKKFDAWLAKPGNRDRVLPFPRSMVAFRVRRDEKERDWGGDACKLFVNFELAELDKLTFFYIRNGDRLYRMNCDLEFGELIFPGKNELNLSEPMMVKMFCSSIQEMITRREYDEKVKEEREQHKKYKKWEKENPGDNNWIQNPYHNSIGFEFETKRYIPFNKSSVYFDDIEQTILDRVKYYNRIALIVQGLFDRSPILHPHSPVKIWTPEGFEAAVELIYDGSDLLHYGEAPDFEVYRNSCNIQLGRDSVTVGQDYFWARREGEKESSRMDRSWRTGNSSYRPKTFRPYGNPGPGYLAKVSEWNQKAKKATYRWDRKRQISTWDSQRGELIPTTIAVPVTSLFNVSAYIPGDYRRFFVDPRTRAQYLKWAPILLAAEEYHAGNLKVGPDGEEE